MTRVALVLASVLALSAPASAKDAVREPPRLSYSVGVRLSAPLLNNARFEWAGLCLAGANGSQGIRLTAPKSDAGPAWSPDGRRLAFSRDSSIFVQDERGRSRMIANPGNHNEHPDWSPNGRRILFDAGAYGSQIYSVRPDGSGLRQLTDPPFMVFDQTPAWSPDGRAIVFSEERQGATDLFLMDAGGSNRRPLTENGWEPSWSPDGSSVVFVRYSKGRQDSDLMIVGADGRGERVLTATPEYERNPAWSPDGEWIAFETRPSSGSDDADIAVIRPDGSGFHVTRGSSLHEVDPAWRPPASKRPGKQRSCAIRGSSRGDVLRGTSLGDLILAGDGRDSLFAGGGADLADGGSGPDRLLGGPGNDVLNGGSGADRLLGGSGSDVLYSDDGEGDVVEGNGGTDGAWVDSLDRLRSVERVYPS